MYISVVIPQFNIYFDQMTGLNFSNNDKRIRAHNVCFSGMKPVDSTKVMLFERCNRPFAIGRQFQFLYFIWSLSQSTLRLFLLLIEATILNLLH